MEARLRIGKARKIQQPLASLRLRIGTFPKIQAPKKAERLSTPRSISSTLTTTRGFLSYLGSPDSKLYFSSAPVFSLGYQESMAL